MARSSYIYLVRENNEPVAAFTVKHEMESWIGRNPDADLVQIAMTIEAREAALDDLERSVTGMATLREDRDVAIVDARFHGASVAEIAYRSGMSREGVRKILAKRG